MDQLNEGIFGNRKPLIERKDLNPDAVEKVVLGFGRMAPISVGHLYMLGQMKEKAEAIDADCQYYLSHSYDGVGSGKFKPGKCKNPLPYKSKLKYCRDAVPFVTFVESPANNFYAVLADAYNNGYREVYIYGGDDRASEYEKAQKYNGTLSKSDPNYFDFDVLEVINAGIRDENSDNPVEQASASLLRKLCSERNYEDFKKYAGTKKLTKQMYDELTNEMGIEGLQEDTHSLHIEDSILKGSDFFKREIDFFKRGLSLLEGSSTGQPAPSQKIDGCLHPETIIKTTEGDIPMSIIIKEYPDKIYKGFGKNISTGTIQEVDLDFATVDNSIKKWVSILTEDNKVIIATSDHLFYTTEGWVEAKDLTGKELHILN